MSEILERSDYVTAEICQVERSSGQEQQINLEAFRLPYLVRD
jgi:hypothetical protein